MDLWIDAPPHAGAWNMAMDQAWLESAQRPLLRVYGWDRPTVTLGYAQRWDLLRDRLPVGWAVVRRWTGGGVVFHESDFTYTLVVPVGHPWAETRPLQSYVEIHQSLAEALVAAGQVGCRLAQKEDVKDLPFCFDAPALHDVMRGVVKVAGAGQRRSRLGLLHQGSVQTVQVGRDFWRGWAARLARQVHEVVEPGQERLERAQVLEAKRYALPGWLEGRDDELSETR
ncbi:MAG: lipoate--protein ligase family protein [Verrucomicrobiales bacterium]|nr:lipoate--protein ligase family protein [Verrucomicrobiales bacterium]